VAFAEVEKFLDTPVKRYSSGMYVRLAFSVAAHLEPEILIIDEVLAVGDAQFQKKCLGKMEDVSRNEGRTVLFVSHNMGAIKSLCTSAIILQNGRILLQGEVYDSLTKYLSAEQTDYSNKTNYVRTRVPSSRIYIDQVDVVDDQTKDYFCLRINLKIRSTQQLRIGINVRLKDEMGFPIAFGCTNNFLPELCQIDIGLNHIKITTEKLSLAVGSYKLGIDLVIPGIEFLDTLDDCVRFDLSNDSAAKRNYGIMQGWGNGSMELIFREVV